MTFIVEQMYQIQKLSLAYHLQYIVKYQGIQSFLSTLTPQSNTILELTKSS